MKPLYVTIMLALLVTFFMCLNMQIDGDTGAVGYFALAVGHGDDGFFLNNFHWTDYDPHTFTDLIVAVPLQILSGYDPTVLKLTGYAIYLSLIAALAFSVFWASGDKRRSVIAVALALSIAAPMTLFSMLVTFHTSVIVLSLLYLLFFHDIAKRNRWHRLVAVVAGVLIIYSDMLFLALFVIPYGGYLLLKRDWKNLGYPAFFSAAAAACMLFKWYVGMSAAKSPGITPIETLIYNIVTLPVNVASIFFTGLWTGLTPTGVIVFAASTIILLNIVSRVDLKTQTTKGQYLITTMGLGAFVMCAGYSIVGAFTLTRFLLYPALFLIVAIALLYNPTHCKSISRSTTMLVGLALILNITYMTTAENLNDDQYKVIDILKQNNITYGYAWFHQSDSLTYLSKGDVKIMSSYPAGDNVTVSRWLNEDAYIHDGGPACIITHNEPAWGYTVKNPANKTIVSGDYTIYLYDDMRIK